MRGCADDERVAIGWWVRISCLDSFESSVAELKAGTVGEDVDAVGSGECSDGLLRN